MYMEKTTNEKIAEAADKLTEAADKAFDALDKAFKSFDNAITEATKDTHNVTIIKKDRYKLYKIFSYWNKLKR